MENKKILIGIFLVCFIALIFAFGNSYKPATKSNKIQVSASFYPLYFFSKEIGGIGADVKNVTPSGAEPHEYEPTAKDIAQIQESQMLVLNSEGFEPWGENIQKNISENIIIVIAGEGLANRQMSQEGENIKDPHIWLNPILAKNMADKIAEGFIKIDSANKDYYQSNTDKLKLGLDDLDKKYKQGLGNCKQKNIITSHAAFSYLAAAYGLNQVAIAGLSPESEPSSKQLSKIVKFAEENNVKHIFFESLASPKLSETIAREIGAKTLVLNPIEGLNADELKEGKNYFTEMENNLKNLKIALECSDKSE